MKISTILRRSKTDRLSPKTGDRRTQRAKDCIIYDVQFPFFNDYQDNGDLILQIAVNEYHVFLKFKDFKTYLYKLFISEKDGRKKRTFNKIMKYYIDKGQADIFCTCPDFQYSFSYMNNKNNTIARPPGNPYLNLAPKIHNKGQKGYACKHIIRVLEDMPSWFKQATDIIKRIISYEEVLYYGDFRPNTQGNYIH